jgi:hypothetical protein
LILLWNLLVVVLIYSTSAYAGQGKLTRAASSDPGVSGYRLHYGQSSRNYAASIDVGSQTSYTVPGLQEGKTYYCAATAISSAGESGFSNEASKAIPYPAPTANFNANPLTGTASLTVSFNDASTGAITNWRWDFGNGATSTAGAVVSGIAFLILVLALAIAFPDPTPFQATVFRTLLSLSAAAFAATIPGFLEVTVASIARATGAIAVFLMVYFFSPAKM